VVVLATAGKKREVSVLELSCKMELVPQIPMEIFQAVISSYPRCKRASAESS
jgi:hypothetical protein